MGKYFYLVSMERKHLLLMALKWLHPTFCANPFEGVDFLLSSKYTAEVAISVARVGGSQSLLGSKFAKVAQIPTAIWLDKISALPLLTSSLEEARKQQKRTGKPALVTIVVYNLPGRDCGAQSSAGELNIGDLDRYRNEYLGPISLLAQEFEDIPKV